MVWQNRRWVSVLLGIAAKACRLVSLQPLALLILSIVTVRAASVPCGPIYTCTSFDVPGATDTVASGINNAGEIVGDYVMNNVQHGFVQNGVGGVPSTINGPGAILITDAAGINNLGQIVGSSDTQTLMFPESSFLDNNGSISTISFPGQPFGINDTGQIVGNSLIPGAGSQLITGILQTESGPASVIAVQGALSTMVNGINDAGQIVGSFVDANKVEHGFVQNGVGGVPTKIDVSGATATLATGINNSGQITGYYSSGSAFYGFVDTADNITTIDFPGANKTTLFPPENGTLALGINDAGQIAGLYHAGPDLAENGFIATPSCTSVLAGAVSTPHLTGNSRSLTGQPTQITMSFTPNFGLTLQQAATDCGVSSFDWQQTILALPAPVPTNLVDKGAHAVPPGAPFNDPADAPVPTYYPPSDITSSIADASFANNCALRVSPDPNSVCLLPLVAGQTLEYYDGPDDPCLALLGVIPIPGSKFCTGVAFGTEDFATTLVGIDNAGNVVSLASDGVKPVFWDDDFNGTTGGLATFTSYAPVDPGSGSGGITLVSSVP